MKRVNARPLADARGSDQSRDRKGAFALLYAIALVFATSGHAQMGRSQDWNTFGGDTGRSGFERSDPRLTKESVAKEFALLYKTKLEESARGQRSVTPPVIISTLISYRGFKELQSPANFPGPPSYYG